MDAAGENYAQEDDFTITPSALFSPEHDDSPDMTLFDLYLGDTFRGLILAYYTDDWFEIEDPAAILEQIEDLREGEELLGLFEGRILKKRSVIGMGKIRFDPYTFRIMIDPDPRFLRVSELSLSKRLPDPENAFSLQQRFGLATSGDISESFNTAINTRTLASKGKFFTRLDASLLNEDSYELTDAIIGGIISDYQLSTGLLQTSGQAFVPSSQFLGLSLGTAEEIFLDQDLIRGSLLEVFVPSRSRVEFFRDNRLLAVQFLDFGLQEIDTSSFPQGSYDVDIVISDADGQISRERRFFTKAGFLASRVRPIFSFQAGIRRNRLDLISTPIYQAGVRYRLSDFLEISSNIYGDSYNAFGLLETSGLYRGLRFGAGINMSERGDSGLTGNLSASIYDFHFNLRGATTLRQRTPSSEEILFDEITAPEPWEEMFNDEPAKTEPVRKLGFQDRTNWSGNLFKRWNIFDFRYLASGNQRADDIRRYTYGPALAMRLIESRERNLRLSASYLSTEAGDIANTSLSFRQRLNNNLQFESQLSYRHQSQREEALLVARLHYDNTSRTGRGTRAVLASELRRNETNLEAINSIDNYLNVDHTSDYLRSNAFVRNRHSRSENNTAVGINAQSSFYLSNDGTFALSYPIGHEAAFIADLTSLYPENISPETQFEILLNNQVYDRIRYGQKSIIGAAPFRTYELSIRPRERDDLVSYDATIHRVTLFPGNVVRKDFNVDKIFIALGRVVTPEGIPIEYQRIRNTKEYSTTEKDGFFQIEINGSEKLHIESRTHNCSITYSIDAPPRYFIDLGDLVCQ